MLAELKDFFSLHKKEKKELKKEIYQLGHIYNLKGYSLEKLEEIRDILCKEKAFLSENKNTEFVRLGYDENSDEVPKVYYKIKYASDFNSTLLSTIPCTPRVLIHCMNNLKDSAKLGYISSIDQLEEMLQKIAKASKYREESWEDAIVKVKENLDLSCLEIEKKLGAKLAKKDLLKIDWNKFCDEIHELVGASYCRVPEKVHVKENQMGGSEVYVKINSENSNNFSTIVISGVDVYQAKNGSLDYKYEMEMSAIWRKFHRDAIMTYVIGDNTSKTKKTM